MSGKSLQHVVEVEGTAFPPCVMIFLEASTVLRKLHQNATARDCVLARLLVLGGPATLP